MNSIERAIESLSRTKQKKQSKTELVRQETIKSVTRRATPDIELPATKLNLVENTKVVQIRESAKKSALKILEIPDKNFKAMGLITPDMPRSKVAEEYRLIKRPLLRNIEKKDIPRGNIIMVTSSLPGEGKTWTSANLAMSIATERDKTVLLVDADAAKGTASQLFNVEPGCPGLIDALTGEVKNLADVMIQTDIPNLRLMPVGENHDHATELLASDNMQNLVDELSQRYSNRVIIFDAPPILPTAEAKVLSTLVGQVVFVVEAENTSHSIVAEALTYLSKEQEVGLILNKSRKNSSSGYGYGYGYELSNGNSNQSQQRVSMQG